MKHMAIRNEGKARGAWFSVHGQCRSARVFNPHLLCRLFEGNVLSVFTYGCELWAPSVVQGCKGDLHKGFGEELHRLFIRMSLWVNKHTTVLAMLEDLRRVPMVIPCVKRVLNFWNRLVQATPSSIMHHAFKEACLLSGSQKGWVHSVHEMLRSIGIHSEVGFEPINVMDVVRNTYKHWSSKVWTIPGLTRNVGGADAGGADDGARVQCLENLAVREWPDTEHDGFKLHKYKQWFRYENKDMPRLNVGDGMCTEQLHKCSKIRVVSAFRLGQSWLNCEQHKRVRSHRTCCVCHKGEIEDELHLLFCEAYSHIRNDYRDTFMSTEYGHLKALYEAGERNNALDKAMRMFMNTSRSGFWNEFADYLIRTKKVREALLRIEI